MNYSENHDSNRSSLESNNSPYYQNSKKSENSNRHSSLKHDNKPSFSNNINPKLETQSRLNYYSTPFIPKQQFPIVADAKNLRHDNNGDSMNRMLISDHENTFFPHSANVNYDTYNSNITNPCLYSQFDFVPLWYQLHNTGASSNYWSLMPNSNYYGLPNLGLSAILESNQNMYMLGKTSENPLHSNGAYNSAVSNLDSNFSTLSLNSSQAKIQPNPQLVPNNRKTTQLTNTNNSGNVNSDAPAPGITWNTYDLNPLDENIQKQMKTNHFYEFNHPLHPNFCKSEEMERYKEILKCITDPKIKKSLAETMQNINPSQFHISNVTRARFFVIKSYSEDDLHRAIKYGVWCSTKTGNQKLDLAYKELNQKVLGNQEPGRLFLFFSVNGSGFFAGIAEMVSSVNPDENCGFWNQNKWMGKFKIKWHYVKDVRNSSLRHIRSEANENKPVTNSRDAIEVTPYDNGMEFIKVFHHAKQETSVFDDFEHYERREMELSFNVQ